MAAMELSKADEFLFEQDHKKEKDDLQEKFNQLQNLLEEKEGEIGGLRDWGRILKLKERKSRQELHQLRLEQSNRQNQELDMRLINDELNEARKELINVLKDVELRGNIGVKWMGELYFDPFLTAMKSKYTDTDAEIKALETWSLWVEYIHDPEWYPFKVITDNGEYQLITDVEDEKLKTLREELGDEVYESVKKAIIECNSGFMSPELWNFSEGGKATLTEGILSILANQMGTVEELKSARSLAISLAKQLDVKNQTLYELDHKCHDLTAEKDRLHRTLSEEMRNMEFIVLQNIKVEQKNDKLKHELVNKMQILEQRTKELDNMRCEIKQEPTSLQIKEKILEPKDCEEIEILKKELSDKNEDYQNLESLNQTLFFKERISNDELQDARKEAIRVLRDNLTQRTTLRIKRMGEVDLKPFRELCLGKSFDVGNLDELSAKLCSKWQKKVGKPKWQPFKKVVIDGNLKEIIDEDDDKLKKLRNEHGDEVYKAVANALVEMNEYNPSGRYVEAEIWYHKENRKATLKEVIQYMFKQWQNNKLKRKRS